MMKRHLFESLATIIDIHKVSTRKIEKNILRLWLQSCIIYIYYYNNYHCPLNKKIVYNFVT